MKILVYGINYAPELTGTGKYTAEMAEWLAARGHQVSVVTAPPYYPQWRVQPGYRAGRYQRETLRGVDVRRAPLWVPARPGGAKRLAHLASFALSSLPSLLRAAVSRPDLVFVVEPALFCAPAAWLAARLCGARAWLHIQDYEVDAAFELGLLKGAGLRGLVRRAETWLMRRFDRVSTISGRMLERALAKGVDPARALLLPNWIDVDRISPDEGGDLRAELGIPPQAMVALYSGNMGGKQGLLTLADAARRLSAHEGIWFVFCGQGPERAPLQDACAGLRRVVFRPAARRAAGRAAAQETSTCCPSAPARPTWSCRPSSRACWPAAGPWCAARRRHRAGRRGAPLRPAGGPRRRRRLGRGRPRPGRRSARRHALGEAARQYAQ
ncbi:WcaI family glycosyltransferase, partial [Achromobacter sp. DMS1]|uniref:WcaI family glycosyltransferase n=1 Tax=Achromobacter sp. DMS1 TaxID=1688405 RepID=UPI000AC6A996